MLPILRALMRAMEAVNRGEGMKIHPIVGKQLSDCGYDVDRGVYVVAEPAIVPEQKFLPPILGRVERITVRWDGDEPVVEIEHSQSDWRFDPFTGQLLQPMSPRGLWERE